MFEDYDLHNVPIGRDGTPYEYFEKLRDYGIETDQQLGWSNAWDGYWAVIGFDAAKHIYHDDENFTTELQTSIPRYKTLNGRQIMLGEMSDPVHAGYRSHINTPFSPTRLRHLEDQVRAVVNEAIDSFAGDGRVEMFEALATRVPARVLALMLGMPAEDGDQMRGWFYAAATIYADTWHGASAGADLGHARKVNSQQEAYFESLISDRKKNPGEDIFSVLVGAEGNQGKLSDLELRDYWDLFLLAGVDNTASFFGNCFWRLAWDPELRRRLRANPGLVPSMVDETLRYYSPITSVVRTVVKPITLAGVDLQPGQRTSIVVPVANRDPRQFENPDAFIPDRKGNRHFTMGLGVHRCLGIHLFKLEARITIEELLRRIPEFELDRGDSTSWAQGTVAGFNRVPVVFESADREAALAPS